MKTAVISQPMRGRSPEEVARVRAQAEKTLAELGYQPHDTVYTHGFSYEAPNCVIHPGAWHIGVAVQRLATADALYLAPGWREARGCRIEEAVAKEYGITIIYGKDS